VKEDTVTFETLTRHVGTAWDGSVLSLCDALEAALQKCAVDAGATGGKSTLTLKLSLKGHGREMAVSATVSTSTPNPAALPSRLYLNKQGALVLDDPKQVPLPFPSEVQK
jgi:hypothetical protein